MNRNMKIVIPIGLIAGAVLSFAGYLAIFAGASEAEATGEWSWNLLLILGYILLFPTMILGHIKELTDFDNMTVETVAMIVVQLAWYVGIAVLLGKIIKKKGNANKNMEVIDANAPKPHV